MIRGTMLEALRKRQTAPMADRGTIMNIVSWILLAIVVCTLIARFAMKLSMKTRKRRLGLDDLFIGLAAVSEETSETASID
jgi:ABC-type amino acid transport system permease subunit